MSRLSFRPRPLDINKRLPVVKSIKEFDDDDMPLTSGTRNSLFARQAQVAAAVVEAETEVNPSANKKPLSEIPTPEFVVVDTYERDYSRTFIQPTSYVRGRGARAELGEFVEYDLDNEDDDWLKEYNKDKKILAPEMFETILFKLEVLDHKTRERAGVINQTLGSPVPVLLTLDAAVEALQFVNIKYYLFQSIYNYWKEKRQRLQKPVLRHIQPPPPATDTNPFNVFRPREKTHRLHTRRMQRRENNVQSFEKLRQVRRNFEQAKTILEALIKREEKKRDVMECEVNLQRVQFKYKHETELVEDSLALSGYMPTSSKCGSSEEEFLDSDDVAYGRPHTRPTLNLPFTDSSLVMGRPIGIKQELKQPYGPNGWLNKKDPEEPVLLFTRPLLPEKMVEAGIVPPSDSLASNGVAPPYKLHGRIGRGGRILFDRWNPLMQTPIECSNPYYVPPKPRSAAYN